VFAHREAFTIELALKKTSYSFGATLTKGILCNWLVCMAVWQGNAAQDITGKLLGIWFPISAFVTMVRAIGSSRRYQHCRFRFSSGSRSVRLISC
jgi:formate/nitrite transporter FocA (FNT family)